MTEFRRVRDEIKMPLPDLSDRIKKRTAPLRV